MPPPDVTPRNMVARFGGICGHCGAPVVGGATRIAYSKGAGVVGCDACAFGEARPAADADPEIDLSGGDAVEVAPALPARSVTFSEEQLAVISWREGEALVAASAGSGKSTTLAERVGALVDEGAPLGSILLLAFNRAAASDLRAKVARRTDCDDSTGKRCVSTFHAYAWRILRSWAEDAGTPVPALLDADDDGPRSRPMALSAMRAARLQGEVDDLLADDLRIREAFLGALPAPTEIAAELECTDEHAATVATFARAFGAERRRANAVDFGDILATVAGECDRRTARALTLRGSVAHLMVDEAQDGNRARWAIVRLLAEGARSLVSVGDLRQSIAGFSGAKPAMFRARLAEGAHLLTIVTNRRSGAEIVETGNRVAAGADWNLGGACLADVTRGAGTVVLADDLPNAATEARWIADDVAARIAAGATITDHAVLVRTNAAAVAIEAAFVARKIPARVRGVRGGIWGSATGQDLLGYLRASEADYRALRRIANRPLRYVRGDDAEKAAGMDRKAWGTISRGLAELRDVVNGLSARGWAARCRAVAELLTYDIRERLGDEGAGDDDRPALVAALADIAIDAGSIRGIEEQIAAAERAQRIPAVEISTIHKVKGQEWPTVYVAGVRGGLFPHARAESPEEIEEERRLFYVAVTRPRDTLIVTSGGPASPFLGWIVPTAPAPTPDPDDDDRADAPEIDLPDAPPAALVAFVADVRSAIDARADRELHGLIAPPPQARPPAPMPAKLAAGLEAIRVAIAVRDATLGVDGAALAQVREIAHVEEGTDPVAGPRAVVVLASAMRRLLAPLRPTEVDVHGQIVFEIQLARSCVALVYSSIATGADSARGVGEDSIRLVVLHRLPGEEDHAARARDAYVARTIGWRRSLLSRFEAAVADVVHAPACAACGAPTRERKRKLDGGTFHSCVRYPACRGAAARATA